MMSAGVGACAVIAMGALGLAFSDISAAEPEPPPGPVTTSEMTSPETITEAPAPETPETTFAEPTVTTTPPEG